VLSAERRRRGRCPRRPPAYGDPLGSGARIYEVRHVLLHSRIATRDGVWTTIDASKLDRRRVVFNNEVDAIVLGIETAAQHEAMLERDMAASKPIAPKAWQRRSFDEQLREIGARLWQNWV
jgi:cardiolipin synthase A/B